jgi:hypothetical protein
LIAAVPLTTALAAGLVLGRSSRTAQERSGRPGGTPSGNDEHQEQPSLSNSKFVIPPQQQPEEEEWEQRLRQAYRIAPEEEA